MTMYQDTCLSGTSSTDHLGGNGKPTSFKIKNVPQRQKKYLFQLQQQKQE